MQIDAAGAANKLVSWMMVWQTFSDVPWNSTEEDLAWVRWISMDLRRKLPAPSACRFWYRCVQWKNIQAFIFSRVQHWTTSILSRIGNGPLLSSLHQYKRFSGDNSGPQVYELASEMIHCCPRGISTNLDRRNWTQYQDNILCTF